MKMTNLIATFFLLIMVGCSKDDQEKKTTLKDKLIGEWVEVLPCNSCNTYTFSQNDTIYQKYKSDETIYRLLYQVICEDSIQVTRLWNIEQNKKTTKHLISFHTNNTVIIKQFIPIDFGTTGFEDIKLTKTK